MCDDAVQLSFSPFQRPDNVVPMEDELPEHGKETSALEAGIHIGDTISFRSIHRNMCVNLDDADSGITWHTESESCLFTIYPVVGDPCAREGHPAIRDGAVVCLFAPNGYFLSFDGKRLAANRPYYVAGPSAEFIVHVEGGGMLHNNDKVFLRNRASLSLLEVASPERTEPNDANAANISRSQSGGDTQVADFVESGWFSVRKVFEPDAHMTTTPRKLRVKRQNRFSPPKLPRYARRCSTQCAFMLKPAHKRLMMRSAITA